MFLEDDAVGLDWEGPNLVGAALFVAGVVELEDFPVFGSGVVVFVGGVADEGSFSGLEGSPCIDVGAAGV